MFKGFSMMAQMAALVGLLTTMPSVIRTAHQGNKMLRDNLHAAQGVMNEKSINQGANKIGLNIGQDLAMQSPSMAMLPKLMSLIGGGSEAESSTVQAKPEPPKCMTAICYNDPDENEDQSGHSQMTKIPAGANAMIVDGKLQIYYPHGKSKQSHK
jgi:hypothetical protein